MRPVVVVIMIDRVIAVILSRRRFIAWWSSMMSNTLKVSSVSLTSFVSSSPDSQTQRPPRVSRAVLLLIGQSRRVFVADLLKWGPYSILDMKSRRKERRGCASDYFHHVFQPAMSHLVWPNRGHSLCGAYSSITPPLVRLILPVYTLESIDTSSGHCVMIQIILSSYHLGFPGNISERCSLNGAIKSYLQSSWFHLSHLDLKRVTAHAWEISGQLTGRNRWRLLNLAHSTLSDSSKILYQAVIEFWQWLCSSVGCRMHGDCV